MKLLKKFWNIFHSMKCAVVLLVILAAACTVGSLIAQGEVAAYYTNVYPEWAANIILATGLDDMFSAWWFILIAALLCLNLALCSILRFPQLRRQYSSAYTLQARQKSGKATRSFLWVPGEDAAKERVFLKLRFRKIEHDESGSRYAVRNRIGIWGSWLCHLGMIAVIIGFGIGQKYMLDTHVYGVPGQVKPIEGTDLEVKIDDFQVLLREDYTVEQYQADLTVTDTVSGRTASGTTMVNEPFHTFGMDFFQNSTGWAASAKVYYKEDLVKEEVLCQGEFISLEEPPLQVQMTAFYPDYYNDGTGPQTLTPLLKNPVVVYTIYYDGNFFQMDAIGTGLPIQIDDYRFIFENPRQYTLIQIVKDPTKLYVGLGGILMLLGIAMAFFCRTEEIWMCEGAEGQVRVYCRSIKGAELFADTVEEMLLAEGQLMREESAKEEKDVTGAG